MVHHFADDTNLLLFDNSLKSMKKKINIDLKLLCQWLAANKISLNSSKTEYLISSQTKTHKLSIKNKDTSNQPLQNYNKNDHVIAPSM